MRFLAWPHPAQGSDPVEHVAPRAGLNGRIRFFSTGSGRGLRSARSTGGMHNESEPAPDLAPLDAALANVPASLRVPTASARGAAGSARDESAPHERSR